MKKMINDFCIECGKFTSHIPYCEDREIMWHGKPVTYSETGRVCSVCGNETQSVEENDESIQQIKDGYRNAY